MIQLLLATCIFHLFPQILIRAKYLHPQHFQSSFMVSSEPSNIAEFSNHGFSNGNIGEILSKEKMKENRRQAVNLNLHIATPKIEYDDDLTKQLMKFLEENDTKARKIDSSTECQKCETFDDHGVDLLPAHKCDEWNEKNKSCFLDRNIGETVTFTLKFGSNNDFPNVVWKHEFYTISGNLSKEFIIDTENPTWNVVVGNRGYEFRVSPITEQDVDSNMFSVSLLESNKGTALASKKLRFIIRVIPINLGYVYLGETLVLNMDSFINLPPQSLKYKWYVERNGQDGILPSNMKKSQSGRILTISELRGEQEGVVSCSVFSNLGVHVVKKRFLISEISQNNLINFPTNQKPKLYNNLRRKNRRLKIENDLDQALKEIEYSNSGLDETTEGFEVPNSDNEMEPPYYLDNQNKENVNQELLTRLKNFQIDPELQRYNQQNKKTTAASAKFDNTNKFRQKSLAGDIPDASRNTEYKKTSYQQNSDYSSNSNQRLDQLQWPISDVIVKNGRDFNGQGPLNQKTKDQNLRKMTNSGNSDVVMEVQRKQEVQEHHVEDMIAKLISECIIDKECSVHATCVKPNDRQKGFCRCLSYFHGNGISCWEDTSLRIVAASKKF